MENIHAEIESLRNDLHRHQDDDREDFKDLRLRTQGLKDDISKLTSAMAEWTGALGLAKWSLGLGVPCILAAVVANVIRHW